MSVNVKRDIWFKGYHDGFGGVESKHNDFDGYDYISGYIEGRDLMRQECRLVHKNQEQEIISEIVFQNVHDYFTAIHEELKSSNNIPGLDDPRPDGVLLSLSFADIDFLVKSYSCSNHAALAYCANKVTPHNSESGLVAISSKLVLSYDGYGFNMRHPSCVFFEQPVNIESLVG